MLGYHRKDGSASVFGEALCPTPSRIDAAELRCANEIAPEADQPCIGEFTVSMTGELITRKAVNNAFIPRRRYLKDGAARTIVVASGASTVFCRAIECAI